MEFEQEIAEQKASLKSLKERLRGLDHELKEVIDQNNKLKNEYKNARNEKKGTHLFAFLRRNFRGEILYFFELLKDCYHPECLRMSDYMNLDIARK